MRVGAIIFILVFSFVSYAQFVDDVLRYSNLNSGAGARAFGLGMAYIGVADDYSAVFWNPAGLAQIRNYEVSGGLNYTAFNNHARVFGRSSSFQNTSASVNTIGLVWPVPTIRGSLTFSAGYVRASDYTGALSFNLFNSQSSIVPSLYDPDPEFDLAFQLYLQDTTGYTEILGNVEQEAVIYESGGLNNWLISGAIDIAKDLSFGATLFIISGGYKYTREFREKDVKNIYNKMPWDFYDLVIDDLIDASISGYGAILGLMYRSPIIRLGVVTRIPSTINIRERYSREGTSSFDNGDTYSYGFTGRTEYKVISPFYFGGGVSFNIRDIVLIAGDIEYVDWTQMEVRDNPDLQYLNSEIKKTFTGTFNLRAGVEVSFPFIADLKFRIGYNYKPSPFKEDEGISARATKILTLGFGVPIRGSFYVNMAYLYGKWSTIHTQYSYILDQELYTLTTAEDIFVRNLIVTFSYEF